MHWHILYYTCTGTYYTIHALAYIILYHTLPNITLLPRNQNEAKQTNKKLYNLERYTVRVTNGIRGIYFSKKHYIIPKSQF